MQKNNSNNLILKAYLDIFKILTVSECTLEEIAEVFLENAKILTSSKYGYVNTIDPESGIAFSRTISKMMDKECQTEGQDKRIEFFPGKNGKYPTLWGLALNQRKPFYCNNPSGHKSSKGVPAGHIPVENFLSVPVIYEDSLIGQIALANCSKGYCRKDIETIKKLTDLYLIALRIKNSEEKKIQEQNKYKTLVENIYEGIWHVDKDSYTIFLNPMTAKMLGYLPEEMMGRHLFDFMDEKGKKIAAKNIEKRKKGIRGKYEFEFIKKDGSSLHAFIDVSPIFDNKGNYEGSLALITDITQIKKAEDELRKSEDKLRLKLGSIMTPEYKIDVIELKNIIDSPAIQDIMNDFYALTKIGVAILDLEGDILVATGWQDICTKFHRVHQESNKNCIESDLFLTENINPGKFKIYKCKNNMWDIATPIVMGGKHVGNLYLGQFFFEDGIFDKNTFIRQAEKFGYDKNEYLKCLEKVPRWNKEKINTVMSFYLKFAQMISNLSYSNLMLAKSVEDYKYAQKQLTKSNESLKKTLEETVNTLAAIVETKDPYTSGHQRGVEKLASAIAKELGLKKEIIKAVSLASLVHDVGKISIPESILSKPAKLTEIEFAMVKSHPESGYQIMKEIDFGYPIAEIVRQHHERLDGSGYPKGLKKDEIMLEAKIIIVADVVEAMMSHRPHRPSLGLDAAINEIKSKAGIFYDEIIAEACINLFLKKDFIF